MSNSFYSETELARLGLANYGRGVLISRHARIYGAEKIWLGNDVRIDDFSILSASGEIEIGSYIHIAPYAAIYGEAGVTMEDYTCISSRTVLYSASDDYSGESLTNPMLPRELKPLYRSAPIILRKHVLVGTCTTVLPGVEMGEGVAIGAHSLVTQSCPAWGLYVGVPARRIKERSRKLLELEREFLSMRGSHENG